ncbi:MAG: hypothetical protein ABXS93_09065 [Sulfurimonas sp.]
MDLQQFTKLFNPLPGNRYLQVTTEPDATTDMLQKLMDEVEGELRLVHYEDDALSKPFRALPREYDMVIFKDILSKHLRFEQLLKIAYTTLANAAHIIIMEKKGEMDIEKTIDLLDRFEFRSPNYIDNIVEGYDLVMAKKLHMWGNGL